ncbi:MAG: hypothetical protein CW716_03305 [Candidatus Bathyarchaeum sp.]|nr:MAG: hypothetical protein CW716_03305 [Candidatus Bathyarchaeum sp.]
MDQLRIRAYNVLFGDAFLVTFPEVDKNGKNAIRNILIDFGNLPGGRVGGSDSVFEPIIKDIVKELNGQPLDLYVMTHEHMDHTQGLVYSEKKVYEADDTELQGILKTRYAWLTASAADDYYQKFPKAEEIDLMFKKIHSMIGNLFNALKANGEEVPEDVWVLWANNDSRSRDGCVNYIQSLAPDTTRYVYRGYDEENSHPFTEAKIEFWAPEQDTSTYYDMLHIMPMGLGVTEENKKTGQQCTLTRVIPPPGVYSGAFYNLVKMRGCYLENLLAIDKAKNNTSVVFCLEWRGIRLLFTGDAEKASWKMIDKKVKLEPVHFLKVSHHASKTGLPDIDILNKFYPENKTDNVPRCALVSTFEGSQWKTIPDKDTLDEIRKRCDNFIEVHKQTKEGEHLDIIYDAPQQGELFVASKNSEVYHKPSCYWATKISPTNKILFATAQDAKNQGYRPCRCI